MKESIQKLLDYQTKGFYFHGSPNHNIEILEPRATRDTDPRRTFNTDTAVFATEFAQTAVIFAVVGRDKLPLKIQPGSWQTVWNEDGSEVLAKIQKSWKEHVEQMDGIVYVFRRSHFWLNSEAK